MKSQFLHVSLYGRRKRPGAGRHETARGILNEAARVPSASGHIPNPGPPLLIHGKPPAAIAKDVETLGITSRDRRGRKLRSDAGLIMCVVASYPVPLENRTASRDYISWQDLTLSWLKNQFGNNLAGAVEHIDETYAHVHAFVLPSQAQDGQLQWELIHPGRRAKSQAAANGASGRDQDQAYISAMRTWQDSFHQAVGSHFGHERVTVRRERRLRQDHLLITSLEAENARLSAMIRALEGRVAEMSSRPLVLKATEEAEIAETWDFDYLHGTEEIDAPPLNEEHRSDEDDRSYDELEEEMEEDPDQEWDESREAEMGAGFDNEPSSSED